MKSIVVSLMIALTFSITDSFSQSADLKTKILLANKLIDEGVVKKNLVSLDTLYAKDFIFTHGTGLVDSKKSWLENVAKKEQVFISRVQDSTTVELHPDFALVTGKVSISRKDNDKAINYGIWYVRIFAPRGKFWQLVSHRTTKEWHY
jgi:hypothetical protein